LSEAHSNGGIPWWAADRRAGLDAVELDDSERVNEPERSMLARMLRGPSVRGMIGEALT
jgi:hypothetical protein